MKFNESNLGKRTLKKVKDVKPCIVCDTKTQYIDYLTGARYCSEECYDSSMEEMSRWARGKEDSILYFIK